MTGEAASASAAGAPGRRGVVVHQAGASAPALGSRQIVDRGADLQRRIKRQTLQNAFPFRDAAPGFSFLASPHSRRHPAIKVDFSRLSRRQSAAGERTALRFDISREAADRASICSATKNRGRPLVSI